MRARRSRGAKEAPANTGSAARQGSEPIEGLDTSAGARPRRRQKDQCEKGRPSQRPLWSVCGRCAGGQTGFSSSNLGESVWERRQIDAAARQVAAACFACILSAHLPRPFVVASHTSLPNGLRRGKHGRSCTGNSSAEQRLTASRLAGPFACIYMASSPEVPTQNKGTGGKQRRCKAKPASQHPTHKKRSQARTGRLDSCTKQLHYSVQWRRGERKYRQNSLSGLQQPTLMERG